jgi:hypothetical protein
MAGKRGYWITKDISDNKPIKREPMELDESLDALLWRARTANPIDYRQKVDEQIKELSKEKDKKRNSGLKAK